jgi:hypothetical protein
MTWKGARRAVSVDVGVNVDIDEFSETQMLQGLIDAGWISDDEAAAIQTRATGAPSTQPLSLGATTFKPDEIEMAADEVARGRPREAIIHLERAFGWIGRLT